MFQTRCVPFCPTQVSAQGEVNFEARSFYELLVVATERRTPESRFVTTAPLRVQVSDVNEPPRFVGAATVIASGVFKCNAHAS